MPEPKTEGYPLIIDEGDKIQFYTRKSHEKMGHVNKSWLDMITKEQIKDHKHPLVKDAYYCHIGEQEFDQIEDK